MSGRGVGTRGTRRTRTLLSEIDTMTGKISKKNPYSQLRRYTRSNARKTALAAAKAKIEYLDRVRVIMEKVNDPDDTKRNEARSTILKGLNAVGHLYFPPRPNSKIRYTPYRDIFFEEMDPHPIKALRKEEFIGEYERMVSGNKDEDEDEDEDENENEYEDEDEDEDENENEGENEDENEYNLEKDEASFCDDYRHAALIDVDTLEVLEASAELARTDYVFTWKAIQKLPLKVAGTRLVAIHLDVVDEAQIFFPIPE
jgi:hypothetical protein